MNVIKFSDRIGRMWKIDFPEYIWKIFLGTDPEYIKNRLFEVCSNITCNADDYLMNHDTIVGYGIYLTMIQLDYEYNGCVATADCIYRKSEKVEYENLMRSAGIDVQEFFETKHTIKELDSIASIIVDHKKNSFDNNYTLPTRDYNGMITYKSCFYTSQPIELKNMFHSMMANFKWNEIFGIIYRHSIYGIAYCNAVERCAIRGDDVIYLIPSVNIIFEEFRKLLIKYETRGFKLQPIIKKLYVDEHDSKKERYV